MVIWSYVLMCFIFGTTFLAIKIGVDAGLPPFLSAGGRFLLAGALIFLWMLWRRKVRLSLLLRWELLLSGLGLTFMTFATLYWAEQHIASGIAAVLSATGPILILVMQTVFLRQASSRSAVTGCVIGFAGVLLLVLPSLTLEMNLLWAGSCLLILVGETGYAAGTLYSRSLVLKFRGTSPVAMNSVQMMYGGGGLLLLSLLTEQYTPNAVQGFTAWGSLLYLIVIGSMLGHSLYYWLLSATNAVFPSTWLYISPAIALGIGALWYNEAITWPSLAGAALILGGVLTANWQALRTLFLRRTASPAG